MLQYYKYKDNASKIRNTIIFVFCILVLWLTYVISNEKKMNQYFQSETFIPKYLSRQKSGTFLRKQTGKAEPILGATAQQLFPGVTQQQNPFILILQSEMHVFSQLPCSCLNLSSVKSAENTPWSQANNPFLLYHWELLFCFFLISFTNVAKLIYLNLPLCHFTRNTTLWKGWKQGGGKEESWAITAHTNPSNQETLLYV